jgi:hypothetical protein
MISNQQSGQVTSDRLHHPVKIINTMTRNSCEEDVETTEGEGVDFLAELLELSGWTLVDDEETEKDLS